MEDENLPKKTFLETFEKFENLYLISYYDLDEIINFIGRESVGKCKGLFCNDANSYYKVQSEHELKIGYKNSFDWSRKILSDCRDYIKGTKYFYRWGGRHFENKGGMITISSVGKRATAEQKEKYSEWDSENNERLEFVESVNKRFRNYNAYKAGNVSVNIVPSGHERKQVLKFINNDFVYLGSDGDVKNEIESKKLSGEYREILGLGDLIEYLEKS